MRNIYLGMHLVTAASATMILILLSNSFFRTGELDILFTLIPAAAAAPALLGGTYRLYRNDRGSYWLIASRAVLFVGSILGILLVIAFILAGNEYISDFGAFPSSIFDSPRSAAVFSFPLLALVTFVLSFFI